MEYPSDKVSEPFWYFYLNGELSITLKIYHFGTADLVLQDFDQEDFPGGMACTKVQWSFVKKSRNSKRVNPITTGNWHVDSVILMPGQQSTFISEATRHWQNTQC